MTAILRAPALQGARRFARTYADTHVERPLARALKVTRAFRRRTDVLYLGESSLLHISPHDTDRRRLGEMLADAGGVDVTQYYGPGYSAALFAELVRLVRPLPRPRGVVVSLCIRTSTHAHVRLHPIFGYRRSIAVLGSARSIDARLVPKLYKARPSEAEYLEFDRGSHRSRWDLAASHGEYRAALRGYDPSRAPVEQQRLLFDYFHGEFTAGSPGLQKAQALGDNLRSLDVPVIAYRAYMPMGTGQALLGAEFAQHVEANFRLLEDAFALGLGRDATVAVEAPPDAHFVDSRDGTEHLNEVGRKRLVEALTPHVNAMTR